MAHLMPLDSGGTDFFDSFKDGVLMCRLVCLAIPGSIGAPTDATAVRMIATSEAVLRDAPKLSRTTFGLLYAVSLFLCHKFLESKVRHESHIVQTQPWAVMFYGMDGNFLWCGRGRLWRKGQGSPNSCMPS